MENEEINKIKGVIKISPTDYIYISVVIFIIAIITIIFFHSTSFIVKNINKIFLTTEGGNAQSLNMVRYSLIEKKLNLPKNNQFIPVLDINTEQIPIKEEIVAKSEDNKKNIKISIINTTTKAGAASMLSKKLENSGFFKATTESNNTLSNSTIISIKNSQKEYKDSIVTTVRETYPNATTKINPENSIYDVIITIGK